VKGLSIGVQPRFGYAIFDGKFPPQPPPGPPFPTSQSLSGTGWAVAAGLNWQPVDMLKLGFSYRSKLSETLKGPFKANGQVQDPNSSVTFATPDTFRLGAALNLANVLTVVPELRYSVFSGSNQKQTTSIKGQTAIPGGTCDSNGVCVVNTNWKDAWTAALGLELHVIPLLSIRAGGSVGSSATPASTISPFDVPPGTIGSLGGGLGLKLDVLQIDAGVFDQFGSATVTAADGDQRGNPGKYTLNSVFFALSATLRM
jgi:long-subunit fatty acid transport protein